MFARTFLAALSVAAAVPAIHAGNVFVVPQSNGSAANVTVSVYNSDNYTQVNAFQAPQPVAVFTLPSGAKHYAVTSAGSDTLVVLDGGNYAALKRFNFGSAGVAAAMTPNGARIVALAGQSANILDTTSDTIVSSTLDVGNSPNDVSISLDSARAFVLSSSSNRLTVIDLSSSTVLKQIAIPGVSTGVATGPNGFIYVSATNLLLEIDPATMTVRNSLSLNARPGKVSFTPDGKYAIAVNQTIVTGSSVMLFDLGNKTLAGTVPNFNTVLSNIVAVNNNKAYITSAQTQTLYDVTIPTLGINATTASGFLNFTNVPAAASSNEVPSRFLFLKADSPGGGSVGGSIYRLDLTTFPISILPTSAPPSVQGMFYTASAVTGTPAIVLGYNTNTTVKPGETTSPLVARVLDAQNRPLSGVSVTFSTSAGTLNGTTFTTSPDGFVQTTAVAPAGGGNFTVTATSGTATAQFTVNVGTTVGGGGGAPGGIAIFSGNGQLAQEQFQIQKAFVIRVTDGNGNPFANQNVNWAISQGFGTLITSTSVGDIILNSQCSGTTCTSTTDVNGLAAVGFLATGVPGGFSYISTTVTAATASGSVNFVVTTVLGSLPGGGQAPAPTVELLAPDASRTITGKTGQTIAGAIKARAIVTGGPQIGQTIPNVGLTIRNPIDKTLSPAASCVGGTPLADINGVITCDLIIGGKVGMTQIQANVGEFINTNPINLIINPGDPALLRVVQGNNQSGRAGQQLQLAFVASIEDGFGNILPGATAQFEIVTPNTINLANVFTVADSNGRVSALGTLGAIPGSYQVRVRSGTATAIFNFTVNITLSQLNKLSGDGQNSAINRPFGGQLIVEVKDDRGAAVPGAQVSWSVSQGSATLANPQTSTDSSGRATNSVTAGPVPGQIVISVSVANLNTFFTLTSRLPGPVFAGNPIVNAASGLPGITPCGVATLLGSGLIPNLSGTFNSVNGPLGPLPTTFQGITITFDGNPAPIFQVANVGGQESVTFQAPCELGAPATVTMAVNTAASGATSIPGIQVQGYSAGIFETNPGPGQRRYATAVRPDGSFVTPTNPAQRGEAIRIFVTGLGQTSPEIRTNRVGSAGQKVNAGIIVGLNDEGVRLISAEYAPDLIGVYVVTLEIPANATTGQYRNLAVGVAGPNDTLLSVGGSVLAGIQ